MALISRHCPVQRDKGGDYLVYHAYGRMHADGWPIAVTS
jgi:hypothetical protein